MAVAYGILYQDIVPTTDTEAFRTTLGTGTAIMVRSILLRNYHATLSAVLTINVVPNGGIVAEETEWCEITLLAGERAEWDGYLPLGNGEAVVVRASAATRLVVTFAGVEVTD